MIKIHPTHYLALDESLLRAGDFYRFCPERKRWAQYTNGRFSGYYIPEPGTHCGLPLKKFPQERALALIPARCGGRCNWFTWLLHRLSQ